MNLRPARPDGFAIAAAGANRVAALQDQGRVAVGERLDFADPIDGHDHAPVNADEPVRIEDVCSAVHASRPALHRSFRAAFGTSPMAYLKSLRLSAARGDLKTARRGTTVAAVAMRWGFFRLGTFSADYRAMFGEKPSETLSRARGRSAVDARSRLPAAMLDS